MSASMATLSLSIHLQCGFVLAWNETGARDIGVSWGIESLS